MANIYLGNLGPIALEAETTVVHGVTAIVGARRLRAISRDDGPT